MNWWMDGLTDGLVDGLVGVLVDVWMRRMDG